MIVWNEESIKGIMQSSVVSVWHRKVMNLYVNGLELLEYRQDISHDFLFQHHGRV